MAARDANLLRRGRILEMSTLVWNVVGIVVPAGAAVAARRVALPGFGLDSLVEIRANGVVLWELSETGAERQIRALRLTGGAFLALALYLLVRSTVSLASGLHPQPSPLGIGWTAVTATAMFTLARARRAAAAPSTIRYCYRRAVSPRSTGFSPWLCSSG